MRTALIVIGSVLLILVLLLLTFYFWASGSVHGSEQHEHVQSYTAAPLSSLPDTFTVATYNIGYLSGMTNNHPVRRSSALYDANLASARELMRGIDADVIGFQEIDFGSARSFDVQQMDALSDVGDYAYGAMAVNWDTRYVPFPYGGPSVQFGRMFSGQAVLSRFPVIEHRRIVLEAPPNPFWYNAFYLDRLAQVLILNAEPQIALVNVHLEAFHRETRERHAEALVSLVDSLSTSYPILLIGDFNAVPERFADGIVDRPDREQREGDRTTAIIEAIDILTPVYAVHDFGGSHNTFPADDPSIKLDHIYFDNRYFELVDAEIVDRGGEPPSDHHPVVARFRMAGQTN